MNTDIGERPLTFAEPNNNHHVIHSYSQDEVETFCHHINYFLAVPIISRIFLIINFHFYHKNDVDLKDKLPIGPKGNQLFESVGDGIILW